MRKLGIITFHSSHNEGAVLQALALATQLSRTLPEWRVEIVDAYYARKQDWYDQSRDARAERIERFARTRLPLSSNRYVLRGGDRDIIHRVRRQYDALIYGSDEIWKLHYKSHFLGLWKRQSHPFYPAFPNIYWPEPALKAPAVAYAVSIGDMVPEAIPNRHRSMMRTALRSLSLIGVRDSETHRFIERLVPELASSIIKVPDPTFSISLVSDRDGEDARRSLSDWGVNFSRPTVAILARDSDTVAPAIRYYRARGYQTVSLTLPQPEVDVDLSGKPLDPVQWMAGLSLFSVCISERMHACISCLLGSTPVMALDYHVSDFRSSSKLKDLFDDFGLSSFHFAARMESSDRLLEICRRLEEHDWPGDNIQRTIGQFRQRSDEVAQSVRDLLETVEV